MKLLRCHCGPLIKAIDAYLRKADDDLSDALEEEGYAEPEKTVRRMNRLEDAVTDALTEETRHFKSAMESPVDLETFAALVWPSVKLGDPLKATLTAVFLEQFSTFMPQFVGYYLKRTDKNLKLEQVSKRTVAWVESWSEELSGIMQLNSHKEVEDILTTGLKDGFGIEEFTRRVLESGIRNERYKARRVALTEVLRAHSVAQQEAFMQSPSVKEKMWKHTGAYRNDPRQNHVDMNGKRVPVAEPFELTGANGKTYHPMYPRDTILPAGESVNCHCLCQPVVDEDILGMSLEERKKLQQQAIDEMDDEWEKELDARNRTKAGIEINPENTDFPLDYERESDIMAPEDMLETGAKKTTGWQDRHAELYYEEIRNRSPYSDARKIAANVSGFTMEDIEDIRQHVFIREHPRDGRVARFDADYEQAQVWQRLVEGKDIWDSDLVLLRHEQMESHIMRETGCTYEEAHEQANAIHNWWQEHKKEAKIRGKL